MIKFSLSVPTFNTKWWEASKNELSKTLLEENQESWTREEDPQTQRRWSPLTAIYAARKNRAYPGSLILRRSGVMQDGTRILPLNSKGIFTARMGTSYGAFHMSGTSRMAARPWLGIPSAATPKMESIVAKAILKGSNRKF